MTNLARYGVTDIRKKQAIASPFLCEKTCIKVSLQKTKAQRYWTAS
ncbi:MAG: hypothetical protein SAK29_11075 [Scytonema sp. PMC 1069.18]|nr:hypothetical protein [Scytonema sp. PMC 1069.18]MEC4885753.1 hypothetical protein [Scytonema sp. PMC 1070.18]